jgi:hypothetical protein
VRAIRRLPPLAQSDLPSAALRLYARLSKATHSSLERMAAISEPRVMQARDMPSFEPVEIAYTRCLFLAALQLDLEMIRRLFLDRVGTSWSPQIVQHLEEALKKLTPFQEVLDRFTKGYLVHREHAQLGSGRQVLYSVDLDGRIEYPTKSKPSLTAEEAKTLETHIQKRFLLDEP